MKLLLAIDGLIFGLALLVLAIGVLFFSLAKVIEVSSGMHRRLRTRRRERRALRELRKDLDRL